MQRRMSGSGVEVESKEVEGEEDTDKTVMRNVASAVV